MISDQQARQLEWREKQIALIKAGPEYGAYAGLACRTVGEEPICTTPNAADLSISKRRFEGQVKAWRLDIRKAAACNVSPAVYFFVNKAEMESFNISAAYPGLSMIGG